MDYEKPDGGSNGQGDSDNPLSEVGEAPMGAARAGEKDSSV